MTILFLNTWNAEVENDFKAYLQTVAPTIDVFCFQEAFAKTTESVKDILAGYRLVSAHKELNEKDTFAQSTYVKNYINVIHTTTILADDTQAGLGLRVTLETSSGTLDIVNFHGASRPVDKLDDDNRLRASSRLIEAIALNNKRAIIGGDFNLFPETESIKVFSRSGYTDLIQTHDIKTTRNHYVWDRYPIKHYYSDYVFVGSDIKVTSFHVPAIDVSDHLPLLLTIDETHIAIT